MPELPDVEVFKQYLDSTALHQQIDRVMRVDADLVEGCSAATVQRHLRGNALESTRRHGKYLFTELKSGDRWLVLHFGMTGFLAYFQDASKRPEHARLLLRFTTGYHLAYDNQRKLGLIALTDDVDAYIANKALGPDPLVSGLTLEGFKEALAGGRGAVKSTLMNQARLAGIGNIYSDEILFQARVHPKTPVEDLDARTLRKLYRAMMETVLPESIEAKAQPDQLPASFLIPHRAKDGTCPRCGRRLKVMKISGRTAYVCTGCQG